MCVCEYSYVNPFVIVHIFISNSFNNKKISVTVTDYSYIYFVIKWHNSFTCNYLLSTTAKKDILENACNKTVNGSHSFFLPTIEVTC